LGFKEFKEWRIDMARGKYKRRRERKPLQGITTADLGFNTRLVNTLAKANIHTLADLSGQTKESLGAIPGMGSASVHTVLEALAEKNITIQNSYIQSV
jgi:DNA-directed RNA polymerase alpha subunit